MTVTNETAQQYAERVISRVKRLVPPAQSPYFRAVAAHIQGGPAFAVALDTADGFINPRKVFEESLGHYEAASNYLRDLRIPALSATDVYRQDAQRCLLYGASRYLHFTRVLLKVVAAYVPPNTQHYDRANHYLSLLSDIGPYRKVSHRPRVHLTLIGGTEAHP